MVDFHVVNPLTMFCCRFYWYRMGLFTAWFNRFGCQTLLPVHHEETVLVYNSFILPLALSFKTKRSASTDEGQRFWVNLDSTSECLPWGPIRVYLETERLGFTLRDYTVSGYSVYGSKPELLTTSSHLFSGRLTKSWKRVQISYEMTKQEESEFTHAILR